MVFWIHTIWVCNGNSSLILFRDFIFPSSLSSNLTALIVSPFLSWFLLLFQYNDLLPPLHVVFCWDIVRTTFYPALPLVTCRVNSWQRFFGTRACLLLWLVRKRFPLVAKSWCHIPVTLSLHSFNLFRYFVVNGCYNDQMQLKNGWSILFWSYYCLSFCNILDVGFCDLCVVLQ